MTDKSKIAVLGAGSWGTALANLAAENGNQVTIWSRNDEQVDEINNLHTNDKYLPDAKLDEHLKATANMEEAIQDSEVILSVVPTLATEAVAQQLAPLLKDKKVLIGHATKGLQPETNFRISQIIEKIIPAANRKDMFFLAGPSHAESVVKHDLTAISVNSINRENNQIIQQIFSNDFFRVYANNDLASAEYASAFKNVIAIAGGALAGAGFGDNASAALITRSLYEMKLLIKHLGGKPESLDGLSGLGDLIVTATSENSRNYRAGMQLAKGKTKTEIENDLQMVIEGFNTTAIVQKIISEEHLDLPIFSAVYDLVYNEKNVNSLIEQLMQRPLRSEDE
jgi:glycerol-3-phosphate dehydrogenase (NAD(P)+)